MSLVERARDDLGAGLLDRCIADGGRERREREGQRRLLDHVDDLIREYVG